MSNIQVGNRCLIELLLTNGAEDQYPQAHVYDQDSLFLISIDLIHQGLGCYSGLPYNMPDTTYIKVIYIVYSDVMHAVENIQYKRLVEVYNKLVSDDFKADVSGIPTDVTTAMEADGSKLSFMSDIEGGRWLREGSQMIFYKENNETEIARFNLFKANGLSATENDNVFERKRIL